MSKTEAARLLAQANTPEGQHAFLTIQITPEGTQEALARWPVQVSGYDAAYNAAADAAVERAFSYVWEVYPPEGETPGENPDPDKIARALRLGYRVEQGARGWHFVKPDGDQDSEAFSDPTGAWEQAGGDSGLWEADHGDGAEDDEPGVELVSSGLYSVELVLHATAYVRADSATEALEKARRIMGTGLVFSDRDLTPLEGPTITGRSYDDPGLPEVSLSPCMTFADAPTDEPTVAAPDAYLARFPEDQRATADRAYQDGFADGANESQINTTEPEGAAILAALRCYQDILRGDRPDLPGLDDIASNGGAFEPLDADDIGELCERLNTGGPGPDVTVKEGGGQLPPGIAAAGLAEAMGGPLAQEGPAADRARLEADAEAFEREGDTAQAADVRRMIAAEGMTDFEEETLRSLLSAYGGKAVVAALADNGLTFADTLAAFGDHQRRTAPELMPYAEAVDSVASGDDFSSDDTPIVSKGTDPGAYVLTWAWVSNEEAGVPTALEPDDTRAEVAVYESVPKPGPVTPYGFYSTADAAKLLGTDAETLEAALDAEEGAEFFGNSFRAVWHE